MRAIAVVVLVLVLGAAAPAAAEPLSCHLLIFDSLSRPVTGATVTCGGLPAAQRSADDVYLAVGDVADARTVVVTATHRDFPPLTVTLARQDAVLSKLLYLRREGEPYLAIGGIEWPFVPERDRLLVILDDYDRAAAKPIPRAQVLAELAPLLTQWKLVEVPSRGVVDERSRMERCSAGTQVIVALEDGAAFRSRRVRALAALRAHPRVRAAGPLIRSNPRSSGELALGHAITLSGPPAASSDAMAAFAQRHGTTWDPRSRRLVLPSTIGLDAAAIVNRLPRDVPGAHGELELVGQQICLD